GQFVSPIGIAVDGAGNVYVADTENSRIQKFTSTGLFIGSWGSEGSGDGQFVFPVGLAVDDNDNVYVTDPYNECIQKFSSTGVFLAKWGISDFSASGYFTPYGISVDSKGNLYVADVENYCVRKFSSNGEFLNSFNIVGSGYYPITLPVDTAVDSNGVVYVLDYLGCKVQMYSDNGEFLGSFGSEGSGNGQFIAPMGITVDNEGNIYVADTENSRIQKFINPLAVSNLQTAVIGASENSVFFIYADPYRMTSPMATYDVAAGSVIYGMCSNTQVQSFDSNPEFVSQDAADKGRLLLTGKSVVLSGGPGPHWCVKYLEDSRLTPVYFQNDGTNIKFIETKTDTAKVDRALDSIDFDHEDYFVVMTLKDENNNQVFINYGLGWKGTWASGLQLKSMYSTIEDYSNVCYIFHWVDTNSNGIPEINEITQIATA
ncbi:MAG: hypothetical protein PHY74_05650, partial [Candidatus Bathyarchaeota archaeon]|nr:hypothetical protein [Candidatus Bathyarchaeota archaeon]